MATAERKDPYLGYRFVIEIEGLVVGGFSEVTGLQAEIDTEEYQEGGVNDYVHKLPKAAKYPILVLKRGITDSEALWKWHLDMLRGNMKRKTVRIILLDSEGNEKLRWRCAAAFPIKWAGPEFKADGNAVAVESVDLVHMGIERM